MSRRGRRREGVEPLGGFGEELERALRPRAHRPVERERSVRRRLGQRAALGVLAGTLVLAGLFVGGGDEEPFQLVLPDRDWTSPEPLAQRADGTGLAAGGEAREDALGGAPRPGARGAQDPAAPAVGPGADTATR